jgi:hypothetical protein
MIRGGTVAALAAMLVLCAACGGKTWHTTQPVTPTTYGRLDAPIERSVGKLRRLALLPVKVDVTLPLFGGAFSEKRTRAAEEQLAQGWRWGSELFLTGAKGYEVVRVEDLGEELAVLDALAVWAAAAEADQMAPPETARAAAAAGQRLSVDGFLIIRGLERAPNVTTILTILTASLTWPLILLENRQEYRAVIVEAATGRIVWRANVWQSSISMDNPRPKLMPEALFRDIEHAVPKVLAE